LAYVCNGFDSHLTLGGYFPPFVHLVDQIDHILDDNSFKVANGIDQVFELLIRVHVNDNFASVVRAPKPYQVDVADAGFLFCNRSRHTRQMSRFVIEHQSQAFGDLSRTLFDFHNHLRSRPGTIVAGIMKKLQDIIDTQTSCAMGKRRTLQF